MSLTTNQLSDMGSPIKRSSSSVHDLEPPSLKRQKTETVENQDKLNSLVSQLLTTMTQLVTKQNEQKPALKALESEEEHTEQLPTFEGKVSVAKKQQTEQERTVKQPQKTRASG